MQGGVWLHWAGIGSRLHSSTDNEAKAPDDFFAFNPFQVQKQRTACFCLPCRINLLAAPFQCLH